MNNENTIKIGIIGCGHISRRHINSYHVTPECKIIAVCDTDCHKARNLGESMGVDWFDDYRELIQSKDINAISICTPSSTHSDIAIHAAKFHKHVLTEKPMTTTLEKADDMIQACRQAGVVLSVIYQRRAMSHYVVIKKAMASGELGKIILADIYAKYYRSQAYFEKANWRGTWEFDGGGALMNQAIHMIDQLQWQIGDVEEIFAYTKTQVHQIEADDTSVAVLKFKNGAIGTIEATTSVYPDQPHRMEIHGTKGTILIVDDEISQWSIEGPDGQLMDKLKEIHSGISSQNNKIGKETHNFLVADFIHSIKTGKEPLIPGEEGRKALEIILAIYKSSRTGKPVKLPLSTSS